MAKPADVLIPSGGLFASLCVSGRLVTAPAREAVRAVLRQDATQQWKQRRVQGKLASMSEDIYLPCLQPRLFTNITPDPSWRHLCLPADGESIDLSGFMHRCLRAIGGGWTEMLHSNSQANSTAIDYAQQNNQPAPGDGLRQAGLRWRNELNNVVPIPPGIERRWPRLAAWRWLVAHPDREAELNVDVNGSSAHSTNAEKPWEMGYRGMMVRSLGLALRGTGTLEAPEPEEFAVLSQPDRTHAEARIRQSRAAAQHRTARVTSLLLLGLRRARAEYLKRAQACVELMQLALPQPPPAEPVEEAEELHHARPAGPRTPLADWMDGPGAGVLRELRWHAPTSSVAVARIRVAWPGRSPSETTTLRALWSRGVPTTEHGSLQWGTDGPSWEEVMRALEAGPCRCQHSESVDLCWEWPCYGPRPSKRPHQALPLVSRNL
ncbi:unnamed protein product [Symbiodinium sp. CCMP2592]|nr:unnamed protein product [Symbiodinium sp. CCMP2592]